MSRVLIGLIKIYQYFISPLLGPSCRFTPTCSEYSRAAIEKYGVIKGTRVAGQRILRCHPWHPGGADPLP